MAETHHTFCRICEALCGLEVDVEQRSGEPHITAVRPDPDHVATHGYACVKGLKQQHLYTSPDRLTQPMKRVGDDFIPVSWEEALSDIGAAIRRIHRDHHPDATAMYVGTAAGFGVLHPVFAQGFMEGLGSRSMYSSATQDCSNKFAVADHMYGFPFTQPFPDVDRTQCLIVVGANPAISKWSFLQVSNPIERLKAITRRGADLWIVDPRRTESAKVAGRHVFIRPGTDVFFYLAFLHELLATNGIDQGRVEAHMVGMDTVTALAAPWSPERAAEVTRIPPETLRAMVRSYREADGAALYCSTGVNMGGHGALAFWLQEVINATSGNLDRPGGTLVSRGVIDFPKFGKKHGVLTGTARSRIGDFRQVNDAFPGGVLADEILTPGDRQVRALFVTGGNPLITMANAGRLKEALKQLEMLVVVDLFLNETASLAHYVLPATDPTQRPDLPFIFPLMLGLQSRPYLQATEALVPPRGEQRDEATIYLDLARACGRPLWGSKFTQRLLEWARRRHGRRHPESAPSLPQKGLLSLILRLCRQGSFKTLLRHPHGLVRPGHEGESFLGARVLTEDGRVNLAPATLVAQTGRLEAAFQAEKDAGHVMKLIGRRAIMTHNSWTHNYEGFVRGKRSTNYLYVHPEDAARLELAEGALADVTSAVATVRVPVSLHTDLMPGTVALPHGWGHQHAKGLSVASRTTGVNVNLLATDGPDRIEPVSGMAHLTGIAVEISPARGPLCPTSWSGIDPSEPPLSSA